MPFSYILKILLAGVIQTNLFVNIGIESNKDYSKNMWQQSNFLRLNIKLLLENVPNVSTLKGLLYNVGPSVPL